MLSDGSLEATGHRESSATADCGAGGRMWIAVRMKLGCDWFSFLDGLGLLWQLWQKIQASSLGPRRISYNMGGRIVEASAMIKIMVPYSICMCVSIGT